MRVLTFYCNFIERYCFLLSFFVGTGIDPDPMEAAKVFRDLSDRGHPYAQVRFLSFK